MTDHTRTLADAIHEMIFEEWRTLGAAKFGDALPDLAERVATFAEAALMPENRITFMAELTKTVFAQGKEISLSLTLPNDKENREAAAAIGSGTVRVFGVPQRDADGDDDGDPNQMDIDDLTEDTTSHDGKVTITGPDGKELAQFKDAKEFADAAVRAARRGRAAV